MPSVELETPVGAQAKADAAQAAAEATAASLDTAKADLSHAHTESDISDLGSYSATGHAHTESDISDLAHTSDHGALSGLSDDDHTQYLLADGSRAVEAASGHTLASIVAGDASSDARLRLFDGGGILRAQMLWQEGADNFRFITYDATGTLTGLLDVDPDTGAWLNEDGSASDPIWSFNADADTGIYRSGINSIGFSGGGAKLYEMKVGTGGFQPGDDDARDLGGASNRWRDIYAGNAVISTSDANEKDEIADAPVGLDFIRALRPVAYKMRGGTRKHHGLLAQQVKEVMDGQGLSGDDFAGYIDPSVEAERRGRPVREDFDEPIERGEGESDEDWEARLAEHRADEERSYQLAVEEWEAEKAAPLGLRYGEFIGPLIKAVQEQQEIIEAQQQQIVRLEERVARLENRGPIGGGPRV